MGLSDRRGDRRRRARHIVRSEHPDITGQSGAPQTPISGGRTTGSAPPEQTTSGQGSPANTGGSGNAGNGANQGKTGDKNTAH